MGRWLGGLGIAAVLAGGGWGVEKRLSGMRAREEWKGKSE
jgi:hypothetical protein